MKNLIEVVEMERMEAPYSYREAYEYSPARGWKWLQRMCFWVLRKLHCHHMGSTIAYQRHVIDTDKFMEHLMRSASEVFRMMSRRPGVLLIGSEDFAKAMNSVEPSSLFQFNTDIRMGCTDRDGRPSYYLVGMRVVVVPWMRGMVPMFEDLL